MVKPFKAVDGVLDVRVGYTGGHRKNPIYEEVVTQTTGHYEAVQVAYDPLEVNYERLLQIFWDNIDPLDEGGQFYDRGSSYMTAIFYENEEQRRKAEESKRNLQNSKDLNGNLATKILPLTDFYDAEEYHQDYYKKNPLRYESYYTGSGRAAYIDNKKSNSF